MVLETFQNREVEAVFRAYPDDRRKKLMHLRHLIFHTASGNESIGPMEETLKWGQPSYLTSKSKSGTTIRINHIKSKPGQYGLYVHCQTSPIGMYLEIYPDVLNFDSKGMIAWPLTER